MQSVKNSLQLIDPSSEVSTQEKTFLIRGTDEIPIYPEKNTKYSLSFRYLSRHDNQIDEPVKLLIKNNGDSVELGPCRVLSDAGLNGVRGRLVFMNDVYDFECLLGKNKILKLQTPFSDLHSVLDRKDAIRPSFKAYTADLTFDLNVYKKLFDDMDTQYCSEPEVIRDIVQKAIIDTEGQKFIQFLNEKLRELDQIVSDFTLK